MNATRREEEKEKGELLDRTASRPCLRGLGAPRKSNQMLVVSRGGEKRGGRPHTPALQSLKGGGETMNNEVESRFFLQT